MELHSKYDPSNPKESIFDVQKRVAKDFTVRELRAISRASQLFNLLGHLWTLAHHGSGGRGRLVQYNHRNPTQPLTKKTSTN